MELKTEMQWTKDGVCRPDPYSLTIHSPTDTIPESFADFVHDTMAAHALMQAIERFDDAESIVRHADELMREWTK